MTSIGHVDEITREEVRGWALDEGSDIRVPVNIFVNGELHGTCVADHVRPGLADSLGHAVGDDHAFAYAFNPSLSLYRAFRVDVRHARTNEALPDGMRTIHAVSSNRAPLAPILVTSRGRAGTTLLMRQLADHPEVVVADIYPYELELMTYYVAALGVLLAPRFTGTEDDPDLIDGARETGLIGRNPWNRPSLHLAVGGPELERLFDESIPMRLSGLYRNIILDCYGIIARKAEKRQARYMAEKCGLSDDARHGIRALLGDVREIVLIRDPRDFLCSAKSYWKFDTEQALIVLEDSIKSYLEIASRDAADTLFVRYEDLVLKVVETMARIGEFLGLQGLGLRSSADDLFQRHATSATPAASIGRWRQDLNAHEIRQCDVRFRAFMDRFGYS